MKVVAHIIALGFPDSSPMQISAALCMSVKYLQTNWEKIKQRTQSH